MSQFEDLEILLRFDSQPSDPILGRQAHLRKPRRFPP